MKRIYLYTGFGALLVLIIGFWVYSFLYGKPENTDNFFTNLGIFGQDNSVVIETPTNINETPTIDVSTEKLRQLTTKPTIGARLIQNSSSTIMRYVEAGTGHIFDIDLTTGQETRVSQISVPIASEAALSNNGDYVAIRSGYNNQNEVIFIDLTELSNPKNHLLPNQIESFAFSYNNELLFTEFVSGQTEGKSYLESTKQTRRLFTAPFTAHSMSWSNSSTSPHIIYTKAASSMLGYAYEINASGLNRLPESGYGLTVSQGYGSRITGINGNNGEYSTFFTTITNKNSVLPGMVIPEKCTFTRKNQNEAICAYPLSFTNTNFPDGWNRGDYTFNDYVWRINPGGATLLVYPRQSVGRELDIVQPSLSPDEKMLYFINKTDKSLWLYEL